MCKGFYLEFSINKQFRQIIESTFVLYDNGHLTKKNNHVFATKHTSLIFYFDNSRSESYPKINFSLPQSVSSARRKALNGWIFGIKFRYIIPDPRDFITNYDLKHISLLHRQTVESDLTPASLNHVLISICEILDKRLPSPPKNNPAVNEYHKVSILPSHNNYSERTIRRNFIKSNGLPPKKFAMLTRFNNVLFSLLNPDNTMINLALEHSYSDQSHFSREFSQKAGVTPSQFKNVWINHKNVHFFQDYQMESNVRFALTMI